MVYETVGYKTSETQPSRTGCPVALAEIGESLISDISFSLLSPSRVNR
jgi:hypothetical protein